MVSQKVTVMNASGLHARPAWALKEQCSAWRSDIRFINRRLHTHADA